MQETDTNAVPSLWVKQTVAKSFELAPFSIKCSTRVDVEPGGLSYLLGRLLPSQSCSSTEQEDLKLNVKRAAPGHLPGRAAQRQIDCRRPRACIWLVAAWAPRMPQCVLL